MSRVQLYLSLLTSVNSRSANLKHPHRMPILAQDPQGSLMVPPPPPRFASARAAACSTSQPGGKPKVLSRSRSISLGGHPAWFFSSFNTVHQPILKSAERKAYWEGDNTEHVFVISHATTWVTSLRSMSSAPLNLPHSYSREVQLKPMEN